MRRVPTLALLAGIAALPGGRALADPVPRAPAQRTPPRPELGDCARARLAGRPCQLTIEPEQVGGDRPVPDGADLRLRRFEPAGSMLRLRREFVAQIVKSADDL